MDMKRTSIYISKSVLEDAKQNRLNISAICEMALRAAMGEDVSITRTRTHTTEEEQPPRKKRDNQISPYYARLITIQDMMKTVGAWDTDDFQKGTAVKFIKETCGGDPRTIEKYCSDLETEWVKSICDSSLLEVKAVRMPQN